MRKKLFERFAKIIRKVNLGTIGIFIAALSLAVTIYSQQIDREYKEALIRPNLVTEIETGNFGFYLTNNGLGPAQIIRLTIDDNGKCIDLRGLDPKRFDSMRRFSAYIVQYFSKLFQDSARSKPYWASGNILSPGVMIRPGQHVALFAVRRDSIGQLDAHLTAAQSLKQTQDAFLAAAESIPFAFEYCSATGAFCRTDGFQKVRPCLK